MNKTDSKTGKKVGIIRCVDPCENTFINIKDNIVFAGAPYNKKNFFGNTVKAIGIAPNDVLDSILGIHTSDNHNEFIRDMQNIDISSVTYQIEITETLQKVITTSADSLKEAQEKIKSMYNNGDIVLTADDHVATEFRPY